ncbi:hypothetical protein TNCV_1386371 [Trichonephila clavipes]|nr:hypothetical protein TNCV_1386371 [Trichonephila clavipes]
MYATSRLPAAIKRFQRTSVEKCLENVGSGLEKHCLAIRGLAFRGTEEVFGSPHNGSLICALELLAELDPFLREHIEQRAL